MLTASGTFSPGFAFSARPIVFSTSTVAPSLSGRIRQRWP